MKKLIPPAKVKLHAFVDVFRVSIYNVQHRAMYRNQRDSIVVNYIRLHPHAAINPWMLYWFMNKMGYRPAYAAILQKQTRKFSPDTYRILKNFLVRLQMKTVGQPFALLHLVE
ncbi:MAG: hypothetical protein EKK39_00005 [Sphingobacteriales bacterium]|uniref:hypothetical protein n=1 Tax=Hydrotalea flava TaxID=714549 RepID=UPI0008305171|nr:hypothetical protein [Hydrotalea flava]RTL56907.1 MAG: hypothetical protein EKK39_00005 [Sphingobacteriales bacterium]